MKYEGPDQKPEPWVLGVARWVLQGRFGDIDPNDDSTLELAIARCILESRRQAERRMARAVVRSRDGTA